MILSSAAFSRQLSVPFVTNNDLETGRPLTNATERFNIRLGIALTFVVRWQGYTQTAAMMQAVTALTKVFTVSQRTIPVVERLILMKAF